MKNIIDASAAKLAGLQIDTLIKVRNRQITLEQWEWFNKLKKNEREALVRKYKKSKPLAEITEKFDIFADYGIITVPDKYEHVELFSTSSALTPEILNFYNNRNTDDNFSSVRRILKPGEKYHVRAFKQAQSFRGPVRLNECWEFLERKNAIYAGAQGVCLVVEVFGKRLHKNVWFRSFDSCIMFGENRKVLGVRHNLEGCFDFEPYLLSDDFPSQDSVLLCFTEAEVVPGVTGTHF